MSTTDDTDTDASHSNCQITYTLTVEDREMAEELGQKRAESYQQGRTDWKKFDEKGVDETQTLGIKAEIALARLYDDVEVDTSISDDGDDGWDAVITLDGEEYQTDIKTTQYRPNNPRLMVKEWNAGKAEAYILTVPEGRTIRVVGWATADDVVTDENYTSSPSRYSDHMNYELRESELREMPEPDTPQIEEPSRFTFTE